MKILVTSGGTKIKIDRVRSITNMSSGTFGSKIAGQYLTLGHEVIFLKAKGSKSPMSRLVDFRTGVRLAELAKWYTACDANISRYTEYDYTTYEDYSEMLTFIMGLEKPDMILLAAAVSDYGVANYVDGKIRTKGNLSIDLTPLPKIIGTVKQALPNTKLVGFKLLVDSKPEELIEEARKSIANNGCDMVVANDLRDIQLAQHRVHIVTPTAVYDYSNQDHDLAHMVVKHSFQI